MQFFINNHQVPALSASSKENSPAEFISLTFTSQKNKVKSGSIGHG